MSKILVPRAEFKIMQTTCANPGTMQLQLLAVARVNLGQSAERVVEVVMVQVVVTIMVGGVLRKGELLVLLIAMGVVDILSTYSLSYSSYFFFFFFCPSTCQLACQIFLLLCHHPGLSS